MPAVTPLTIAINKRKKLRDEKKKSGTTAERRSEIDREIANLTREINRLSE